MSLRRMLLAPAVVLVVLSAPSVAAEPRLGSDRPCFGAAARAPSGRACPDTRSVEPSPAEAAKLPNSPCETVANADGPPTCTFGVTPAAAARTVALVGDSHAGHWRAALAWVAVARGWHGISITHSSCPLQKALRDLPEPRRSSCRAWKREVFSWFSEHPEVSTVFVAGLTGGSGVVPERGRSAFQTSVLGYERAWRSLPASVRHIVVIRDTPKFHADTNACVERAVDRQLLPGPACRRSRAEALDADPAVAAVKRVNSSRAQTVDLTDFFCATRACFPVVGGVLVLRDNTHVTGTFSATLGPYLDHAVAPLAAGWSD